MAKPNNPSHRGMSLIEGMISMAVLVIGILGALQGIMFASQQNGVAARLARASSMAAQVRAGIEAQGFARLLAGPIANPGVCLPVATPGALGELSDGLVASTLTGACIIDVDAYDTGAALNTKLVSSYDLAKDYNLGNGSFRRVMVYLPAPGAPTFGVVVATRDNGRWIFVKQFVGLYDSSAAGNGTGVDL